MLEFTYIKKQGGEIMLKRLIENNLTDTELKTSKDYKILSMTCFWSKINFSAIIKYKGHKFYCYYKDNNLICEKC
jgi:hypothetical protein